MADYSIVFAFLFLTNPVVLMLIYVEVAQWLSA